jgi:prophage regulatory protein
MFTKLHRREPHRLIRIREVLRKVGVSQSTWYEDVKEGRAPPPVKISERAVAWYEPDIDDLIDARLEGREWHPHGEPVKRAGSS